MIYELQRQLNKESRYNEEYFTDFAAKMTFADSNFFLVVMPFMYNRMKKYQLKVDRKVKEIISKESIYYELIEMTKQHHLEVDTNLYYLSSFIISLTPMTPNIRILDEIMDVMKTIINKFTAHAGSTITDQEHFVDQLHLHFRPLFFRLLFKIPVNNPLTLEIKEKYHYIFNLVERSVGESIVGFNLTFSDSEIAYLTLHFASIYFQITKNRHNNILYQGSIYCPNGIGTSLLLKNELEVLLPNWSFETLSDLNLLNEVSKDSEIIFTTTIIPLNEIQERDIIIVPPILSARDQHTIIEKTSSIVGEKDSIKVAKVLQVVRSHVPENTMKKIMTELQESLEIEMEERKVLPMLSEITKPELI